MKKTFAILLAALPLFSHAADKAPAERPPVLPNMQVSLAMGKQLPKSVVFEGKLLPQQATYRIPDTTRAENCGWHEYSVSVIQKVSGYMVKVDYATNVSLVKNCMTAQEWDSVSMGAVPSSLRRTASTTKESDKPVTTEIPLPGPHEGKVTIRFLGNDAAKGL